MGEVSTLVFYWPAAARFVFDIYALIIVSSILNFSFAATA